jgi:hypothetical protein
MESVIEAFSWDARPSLAPASPVDAATISARACIRTALALVIGAVIAGAAVYAGSFVLGIGPAHSDPQVIEDCHWEAPNWVYPDGALCRGTGEDPTVDGAGRPACADGRLAVVTGPRVTCVALP